jgi:ABC-type sugar transport system ATPase subunit
MRTEVEAPGVEPRDVSGGVTVAGVGKAFGAVQALDGVTLHAAPREVVAVVCRRPTAGRSQRRRRR